MKIIASAHPEVATEFRLDGRQERVVASNGEINAGSRKELLATSMSLMEAHSQGRVITASQAEEQRVRKARNIELLTAAMQDDKARRVLGEKMADNFYMTSNRSGYVRRFLSRIDLRQGDIPRFPVRKKNVRAMIAVGQERIETQVVTDKWLTPPELTIATRLVVPQVEINQSNTDILAEKHTEGLEGLMVTEDRLLYKSFIDSISVDNDRIIASGTMTLNNFVTSRQNVNQWGIKPVYALLASDLFVDIITDNSFINAIEPVARHELVMTGEIGTLYGLTMVSESYRHPEHKVLSAGEWFVLGDSSYLGAYADRGGVDSQPTNMLTERVPGKGWLFSESFALALANTRAVAAGKRI